jgi:hypothetical protein
MFYFTLNYIQSNQKWSYGIFLLALLYSTLILIIFVIYLFHFEAEQYKWARIKAVQIFHKVCLKIASALGRPIYGSILHWLCHCSGPHRAYHTVGLVERSLPRAEAIFKHALWKICTAFILAHLHTHTHTHTHMCGSYGHPPEIQVNLWHQKKTQKS